MGEKGSQKAIEGEDDQTRPQIMKKGLVEQLKRDFPEFRLISGKKFAFRPPKTIVVGPAEEHDSLLLLHELGHALSGHESFSTEVKRMKMEVEAWSRARELAAKYGVEWDEEVAQAELDSYREWLHRKARCRKCGLTRYQTPDGVFHCPKCEQLG